MISGDGEKIPRRYHLGVPTTLDLNDPRAVTRVLARGRIVLGLTLAVAPRLTGPLLGVPAQTPATRYLARVAGVRDALIGLGMEISVREGRFPQGWVGIAGVVDIGDAVVGVVTRKVGLRARLMSLGAAGSAALHLQLARALDDAERAATDDGGAAAVSPS